MFFGKNGSSAAKAGYLDENNFPRFMRIGDPYKVTLRKDLGPILLDGGPTDMLYLYIIEPIHIPGRYYAFSRWEYLVKSPYPLPDEFRVRKLVCNGVQFEILERDDPGYPRQVLDEMERARKFYPVAA